LNIHVAAVLVDHVVLYTSAWSDKGL